MNKRELSTKLAKQTGLTFAVALNAVNTVFQSIQDNLEMSESTVIQGFGSFNVTSRAQRMGINPSTKQPMNIPAHKVVKFTASKKIVVK